MSAEAHTKAAEDHKLTAKVHETAAQCHTKGDHAMALAVVMPVPEME